MFKRPPRKITELHKLNLGTEEVDIQVTLTRRRSTSIIVRPNLCVEVKAPLRSSIPRLMRHVESKAYWVLKQREKFKGRAGSAKPKQYIEGEVFSFLGKAYRLRFIDSKISGIKISDGFLDVGGRSKSARPVKALLRFWYNERAHEVFAGRMPACLDAVEGLKLPQYKKLHVKKMKSRWGSCSSDGTITLNPELVSAPPECIDYVIIHELCHLQEHNHSKRYYKLLTAAMPEWKKYKDILNKHVETNFI